MAPDADPAPLAGSAVRPLDMGTLLAAIRRDDPGRTNDQFGCLVAASQYRLLHRIAARLIRPGGVVLDWGCGRGHFSYFLVKSGVRVVAYSLEHEPEIFGSLSPEERTLLTFVRGATDAARALPFRAGEFDAAFSVGVLEHVRETGGDEGASLAEIRRVLAGDGVFVCYHLPNRYSYIEAASRWMGRRKDSGDGFHRYRFTESTIRRLCRGAGFSVPEIGRYGFIPRNSFNRLPAALGDSRLLCRAANLGDAALERLFSPLDQNYYFVARPETARA